MTGLERDEVKYLNKFFDAFFSPKVPATRHNGFIVAVRNLTEKICHRQFSYESAVAEGGNSLFDEGENTCTGTFCSDSGHTPQSMIKTTSAKSQKSEQPTHKDVPSQIDKLCIPEPKDESNPGRFTRYCRDHEVTTQFLQNTLRKINEDENARAWIALKLFLRDLKRKTPKDDTKKAFHAFLDKSISSISKAGSVDQDTIPVLFPPTKLKKGRFFRFFEYTMTLGYLCKFLDQFTGNPSTYSKSLSSQLSPTSDSDGFPIVNAINKSHKRGDCDNIRRRYAMNPFSSNFNSFSIPSKKLNAADDSSAVKKKAVPSGNRKKRAGCR